EQGEESLRLVAADHAMAKNAPALARLEDVIHILGLKRNHAADRAGAVDVGDRPAYHVHAAQKFRLKIEGAVGIVPGLLKVLTRAVDHHRDASEILQAADIDGRGRVVPTLGERDAGHAE